MNEIQQVIAGSRRSHAVGIPPTDTTRCIFPGSFNPFHQAHREMARFATDYSGLPVEFELSVVNVDKDALNEKEIESRLSQFADQCVWLTHAPTFAEKAELFPECRFVIGADTAIRIFDRKYYKDESSFTNALGTIARHRCKFILFGRLVQNRFVEPASISIPANVSHLFDCIPESSFRRDISSSEIRRQSRES